ncbi:death-associated protein 1 homolog [Littorina saxatilis]|uniref:Death-associated protein 1 n=1 Tax=Littorina saxatilis TaxID=31220 RepID=A0AAN9GLD1_9CAEN
MSANEEAGAAGAEGDLKAGHAPAVKVGGMRVVQHKKEAEKPDQPQMTAEDEEEFGTSPPKADKHHTTQVVSGATTKGDKDFPVQAVKSFHEKPLPSYEKPRPAQATMNINQPR